MVLLVINVITFAMNDQSMSDFEIILINICRSIIKLSRIILILFTKLSIILVKILTILI